MTSTLKRKIDQETSPEGTDSTSHPKKGNENTTPEKRSSKRLAAARESKSKADKEEESTQKTVLEMSKFLGAHISAAGGVFNAVTNMLNINATCCAFFVKSQRKWVSPELTEDVAEKFRKACADAKFDAKKHALVHGSYLINMANADETKREQAFNCFLDDLKRCERLGVGLYNFHPGSYASCEKSQALKNLADCINRAHEATENVTIVTENMAGQGQCLGGVFDDFAELKSLIKDTSRWRVCLDTCHTFAAGFDIRTQETYEQVIQEFDEKVGVEFVGGWHLNDSKAPLGSNRDLHEHIGLGFLGLEPFRLIVNDPRWDGIPLVLETPAEKPEMWAKEIELLTAMIGKKADDPFVVEKNTELQARGASSRKSMQEQFDKKAAAAAKKRTRTPRKRATKKAKKEES
ncbi:AP endonuclease Apn1 [Schizosaccharomyces japonicus yFS275]|uniref:Apurinic-apyrimidinic endonuclease 1 n=1 Tax=Schizosaccharomyces japonicus (strain yFS275 / FY16936) TaxID=402676 RepID=B6K4V1_SCHJY|nr:AP endonuclease Apn1 [Schizosaccharomyces japonicus yFS275]EEB08508.2 AP endonuclease Apn1 [Schizosaccharomyces japonicus yFS275]